MLQPAMLSLAAGARRPLLPARRLLSVLTYLPKLQASIPPSFSAIRSLVGEFEVRPAATRGWRPFLPLSIMTVIFTRLLGIRGTCTTSNRIRGRR